MSTRFLVLIVVAIAIGFAACKNNDNVFKPVAKPANLNIINASADTLGIFVNGTRQNNTSGLFPGSQSFYLPVPSGTQNYQFKKIGSPVVLFSKQWTLDTVQTYTLYIAGETIEKTFNTRDTIPFADSTWVKKGLAATRFASASPDAGQVKITLNDTLFTSAAPFASSSVFKLISAGKKAVKLYLAGSTTPAVTDTITFQTGFVYTLFSRGLKAGKGNSALNVSQAINATN